MLRPMAITHKGACLCGAVRFEVQGDLPGPDACHCTACRKTSGHYWVSTDVPQDALSIDDDAHLTWYASSDKVRRGFCARCGSSLFWDPVHHDTIAIAMGAFETPTCTKLAVHIFVADKGDYYDITDNLPQKEQ